MSARRILVAASLVLVGTVALALNAQDLLIDLKQQTGARQHEAALRLGDYIDPQTGKGYPEVVAALSEKLDDKAAPALVRSACADSLGKLNDLSVYSMVETLAKNADEKGVVRSSCVKAMAALKKDEVIGDFVEMLKVEKVRLVRTTLEEVLTEMKETDRVVVAVSPLLKDPATAPSAIRVLGKVGGSRIVDLLGEQLGSDKAAIRLAVITALGDIPNPKAAEYLLAYYPKAKNEAEKGRILSAFGKHPHPAVVKLLIDELENPETYPAIRRRAALVIGTLKAKPGIKPLVDIMLKTSEHHGLRVTCTQALGNFGDRDDYAIAGLIGALADDKLREIAALSLNRVTDRYFGTNQEKWTEWFQEWRRTRDRRQTIY
ncbi:MAG TPA: HEAT repeat domain-containing protein [Planctomycetota bacterium]|nr:HEAT repeat domain-containing protein [Planctomycetota bacterium]